MSSTPPPNEDPEIERPASAAPPEAETLPAATGHDPYATLRIRDARYFLSGNLLSLLGTQMLSVAIGWEIYQRTNSETALGLVGLAQAIPIICFALFAGQLADAANRKLIVIVTQCLLAVCSVALAAVSFFHASIPHFHALDVGNAWLGGLDAWLASLIPSGLLLKTSSAHFDEPAVPLMYLILFVNGIVRAFNDPAKSSLLPRLVPLGLLSNAITWSSSSFQTAAVVGPAIGGFLAAISYPLVYAIDACGHVALVLLLLPIRSPTVTPSAEKLSLRTVAAGLHFVFQKQVILATITLDLFAVLLGGAVALLPVYAKLLNVGAIGLGFMRAAPAVGALLMGLILAHRPPMRHAGRNLLWAVIGFGAATIIFGLTALFPLYLGQAFGETLGFAIALAMLFFTGALDNISVVVRHTLVQVLTPDAMRGRVSAVNNIFIGSSNELGAFESGITARVFGPMISVVGGGIGTILVVLGCGVIWPQLRKITTLDEHGSPHS
jgi:MFS family permease